MTRESKRLLESLYRAAVAAADPGRLVAAALDGSISGAERLPALIASARRVFMLAAGKASGAMAGAIEERLGPRLIDAIAVVPRGAEPGLSNRVRRFEANHPLPDELSENAVRAALEMLAALTPADLLIVALSGGASALFAMPADGVTMADKIAVNQLLLRSGASIREHNGVRKHLSAVKGGRLLRACGGAQVIGLILSDVPGNDLATIGSGLTTSDPGTFEDARLILKRLRIWGRTPESVRDHLDRGAAGKFAETVKPGDPILERVTNVIVGDNATALDGASRAAVAAGYRIDRSRILKGEAGELGRSLAAYVASITASRTCIIAGGEPVVIVRGRGRGGRAQQCALAMAIELARIGPARRIAALIAGTDGIDGPTDAAGAFIDSASAERARGAGIDPQAALARNDAYPVFDAIDGLLRVGPTGTNVTDIFIGLVDQ